MKSQRGISSIGAVAIIIGVIVFVVIAAAIGIYLLDRQYANPAYQKSTIEVPPSSDTPSVLAPQNQTPLVDASKNCKVYTYQDKYYPGVGKHCLDSIKIKGIYFLAKDQTNEFIPSWSENMKDIFNKMEDFYEAQFNNKITIIIDEPQIVYGDKNTDDYKSAYVVNQEIINKLKLKVVPNYFYALTIFYDSKFGSYSGGGIWDSPDNNGSITNNPLFWLDKESLCTITTKMGTDCSGYINTGHEFGHSLGIPHPWEVEMNRDNNGNIKNNNFGNDAGNIMSYASRNLLSGDSNNPFGGYYIMNEVKQKMIMK